MGELPFKQAQCSLTGEAIIPLDLLYSILDWFHLLFGTTVGVGDFSLVSTVLHSSLLHKKSAVLQVLQINSWIQEIMLLYFKYLHLLTLLFC